MKALIIDDDPISRLFIEETLSPHAHTCCVANGPEGVDEFSRALASGRPFDVVLVDIHMPGMDGHQALEKIRSIERERGADGNSECAVIMVSAMDSPQNVNRAFFQGGAMSFLAKPIDPDVLLDELRKFDLLS